MNQHIQSLSVRDLRKIEARAKALGLSERVLIENASSNLACTIDLLDLGKNALIVAGKGNNGADSLACARKLMLRGYKISAVILAERDLNDEARAQKELLGKLGVPLITINTHNTGRLSKLLSHQDFVIDGILGIGAKGRLSSFLIDVVTRINNSGKTIVSCDIPSGLAADSGETLGAAIRADHTITFLAYKKGFFSKIGRALCGQISVVDIGVSELILRGRKSMLAR